MSITVNRWIEFKPRNGWASFAESKAISDALWSTLDSANWHYLSFTSGSSPWESRTDASLVHVEYKDEPITFIAGNASRRCCRLQRVSACARRLEGLWLYTLFTTKVPLP